MKPLTKLAALMGSGSLVLSAAAGVLVFDLVGDRSGATAANPSGSGTASGSGNGNGGNGGGNGGSDGGSNPGHPITVTGAVVDQLVLGAPSTLRVTIKNENNQDIIVTGVVGTITSVTSGGLAGRPACQASWYSIGAYSGSQRVVRQQSASVALPITLANLDVNQDNCKDSTVSFSFTAQARQA